MVPQDTRIQPKQHFEILDGLRGIAAMMVVIFHLCETWNGDDHAKQIVNHGYLAVDFFFMLSGFVITYAYDDRWHPTTGKLRMTLGDFFKRRLIRLQPMVVSANLLGALLFYQSASPKIAAERQHLIPVAKAEQLRGLSRPALLHILEQPLQGPGTAAHRAPDIAPQAVKQVSDDPGIAAGQQGIRPDTCQLRMDGGITQQRALRLQRAQHSGGSGGDLRAETEGPGEQNAVRRGDCLHGIDRAAPLIDLLVWVDPLCCMASRRYGMARLVEDTGSAGSGGR